MSEIKLFRSADGVWITENDVKKLLAELRAPECDILFIHSDISFGLPNRELRRSELLERLFQCISSTGVRTIIYPTFTYSFCNGENYDVRSSKTSMGALNEYARKQAGHNRSLDPLLSVAAFGDGAREFTAAQTEHSLGRNSVFDLMHRAGNVKFLFFGAEFCECFTYLHYVEKMLDVPYRFDMPFDGSVIDWDGNAHRKRQYIHTACEKIVPVDHYHFKTFLTRQGCFHAARLGDREIAVIGEADAYHWISQKIKERIDYFLERPFSQSDLGHVYTYDRSRGRITHC